jgi:transcription initiation factor TFIID subunit 2
MPGLLLEDMDSQEAPAPKAPEYGFVVSNQKVELEIDFSTKSLTGLTEITILPQTRDLRTIKIDARQCIIPPNGILVNGKAAEHSYEDPMSAVDIPKHYMWGAEQYCMQKTRLDNAMANTRVAGALEITIPKSVRIEEVDPFSENAATPVTQRALGASAARNSSIIVDSGTGPLSTTPTMILKTAAEQPAGFNPLTVTISFSIKHFRDGLHFVGLDEGDARFPHVYSRHSMDPGTASCIFPCIDDPAMRCKWDISIKCSRTLGDALRRRPVVRSHKGLIHHVKKGLVNGDVNGVNGSGAPAEYEAPLSDEEKLLDMAVICSGEMINEVVDLEDSSKKIVSFHCERIVAPQHIGFVIGPFEQLDLSEYREDEDGEKLGQGQSQPIFAYCLPGRTNELRHTCCPMVLALDWFTLTFSTYPFDECKLVFVDDQIRDTEHTASLSLCSTRLLFDETLIDPEMENTRTLVHAIASQWIGVNVIPNQSSDRWVTIGLSHFMTGLFMKNLCGNNDYLFHQKTLADRLVEQDVNRPPLHALGEILHLGPFEYDFMILKAPLVMFILDRRIVKASGSTGLTRILSKIVTGAYTGTSDSVLSTEGFRRLCDKVAKYRQTETFWNQWVLGAGCPRFSIGQKFNKKRLCVEMTISQKQDTVPTQRNLEKGSFHREFKEEVSDVFAGDVQPVFTGPMTIRIHEADGTPYEHTVEIREGLARIEIPYNTKYKRLKRSRRQKERLNAGMSLDINAETADDALYYSLGDVLQTPADMQEWGLLDWDPETEMKMDQESYEWIRIDSDFEWLCEKYFVNMPPYMFVSQLQQDRDVVAQQESMLFLKGRVPHPLVSTFLIRTLVDQRYFWGIRTMAAETLKTHATPDINWTGLRQLEKAFQEFFCYPGTKTPRPNDFTDKRGYWIEQSIAKAMARIRGNDGKCPKDARLFILDQLRFNDNGDNEYSDNFKVANLLSSLAESLIPVKKANNKDVVHFDDEDEEDDEPRQFRKMAIEELDRYRRIDEWTHSYHNIYTVTILDCKQRLMKAGVIPTDPLEFAQYLHDGTSDYVRIKAFEALMDLGLVVNNAVSNLLLNLTSSDSSPYVRNRLFEVFCLGLATVAFGENKQVDASPATDGDGDTLIIEQEASLEARKAHISRTTSIIGAMTALKEELKPDGALREAIWKAIKSPDINASEQYDLLDVCFLLYDAVESMIVKLQLPRYWEAKNLGKARCNCHQIPTITDFCRVSCNSSKLKYD